MIEKINLKKLLPYTIIVSLVIFTAFVPEIFKSSAGKKKIINSQTDMYSTNDPSIDQMLKKIAELSGMKFQKRFKIL